MEQKNRLKFTIAVVLLILSALSVGFGRSFFQLDTPDVVLPSIGQSAADDPTTPGTGPDESVQTVSVTPQTVQNVIATLERTDSYYRMVTIEQFWTGGGSSYDLECWTDQGWTHIFQRLPSGVDRYDLIGPDTAYYWYAGASHSPQYKSLPAKDNAADLAQRLPTYETVLDLDPDVITSAGYESRDGLPCIFVETHQEEADTTTRYWVSVDTGLLVSAERRRADELIYRMTAPQLQSPCPVDARFQLPDGTTLHTV